MDPKFHPTGGRLLVKEYPKDKEYRRLKLSMQLAGKLSTHIQGDSLGAGDLIFPMPQQDSPRRPAARRARPGELGLHQAQRRRAPVPPRNHERVQRGRVPVPALQGRRRDLPGSAALSRKDAPRRPRTVDTDGHISRDWFRQNVWRPALQRAGLIFPVRAHDLRHAHASWLLAGGADLQTVKDRLGHGSIATTEKYLHTLPDADETAVEAFSRIRNRNAITTKRSRGRSA